MLKPLVFFGTEDFSLPALQALIEKGWPVSAVVTKPDTKRGRGQLLASPAVKNLAESNGIEILQPEKMADTAGRLAQIGADWAVLVSYGKIIPADIIDIFKGGIINIHPSLLPKYRGPSPIEAAILNGDSRTGVSLMKLTPKMDAGGVYVQQTVELSGSETKPELYDRLSQMGAALLIDNLEEIIGGRLEAIEQNEAEASYTKLLAKSDGDIDWTDKAVDIERKIRAFQGYPKTRALVFDQPVIILKARVANSLSGGELVMQCGDGFIEIQELIAPSGRTMSGGDFKRGYFKQ